MICIDGREKKSPVEDYCPSSSSELIVENEVTISTEADECESITAPSDEFLHVFNSLPDIPVENYILEKFRYDVWKQYFLTSQRVVLEGNTNGWYACAMYSLMRSQRAMCLFSLHDILNACGISVIEFFDKLERWNDTNSGTKRLKDHVQRVQSSLAVSAVVYKKLLNIFRTVFIYVEDTDPNVLGSDALLTLIWTMFIYLKKLLPTEDLISCFHLLLCIIEFVFQSLCDADLDDLINPVFSQELLNDEEGTLEHLCKIFDGVVLDAKHFKKHRFDSQRRNYLELHNESVSFIHDFDSYTKTWAKRYLDIILKRGELDERIFLPSSSEKVFDNAYDCSPIELLKRGNNQSSFADAELLLRMSTQNCLEKLIDQKEHPTPLTSKSYVITSDQLCPLSPISNTLQNISKFAALVPSDWEFKGSLLEEIYNELCKSTLPNLLERADYFGQVFYDRIVQEAEEKDVGFDPNISIDDLKKHTDSLIQLFLVTLDKIAKYEYSRNTDRPTEFCNVFCKEEFLSAVFICALELFLFSYNSQRVFPWSIKLFNVAPIAFHKIIEIVIRAEPCLSKSMVKHLNRKEEEILEELAWEPNSPIWNALKKIPNCVPTCDVAWNLSRNLSNSFSPAKRRKLNDGSVSPPSPSPTATSVFFRKVYYVCCLRLTDLCDKIRMEERGRKLVWTLLEHILITENSLLKGRHLDQNLLCIIYIVVKSLKMGCSFTEIIQQYKHQPQCKAKVYREVNVPPEIVNNTDMDDGCSRDSGIRSTSSLGESESYETSHQEKVDLIRYYNKIFLPRLEPFMTRIDSDDSIVLIPIPQPKGFGLSPVKRNVAEGVSVVPLSISQTNDRPLKYNMHNSPRRDLQAINQAVRSAHTPFFSLAEVQDKSAFFGNLCRR